MRKAIGGILSAVLLAAPLSAAGASGTRIPAHPQILDPAGDANGSDTTDQPTPASVAAGDILAGWITADQRRVSLHWLLAASPVGVGIDLVMRAVDKDNPVEASRRFDGRCLWFTAEFPNSDSSYEPYAYFVDGCTNPGPYADVTDSGEISNAMTLLVDVLEDGRAIVTVTADRRSSPLLGPGKLLDHLDARSALFRYASEQAVWGRVAPLDSTAVGRDYRLP